MIEFFGRLIVGFKRFIFQRPRGRDAIRVPDLVEVALTKAQQNAAVHFAIATDKIMKSRAKTFSFGVVPSVCGLIARVHKDGLAIPVFAFARQIIAARQEKNTLAGLRQPPSHGATAWSRPDDDNVIMFAAHHGFCLMIWSSFGCSIMFVRIPPPEPFEAVATPNAKVAPDDDSEHHSDSDDPHRTHSPVFA